MSSLLDLSVALGDRTDERLRFTPPFTPFVREVSKCFSKATDVHSIIGMFLRSKMCFYVLEGTWILTWCFGHFIKKVSSSNMQPDRERKSEKKELVIHYAHVESLCLFLYSDLSQ